MLNRSVNCRPVDGDRPAQPRGSYRRIYASLHAVLGDDPPYVSEQMGHKSVELTLNVYSRAVKRRAKLSGAYLAEFDRALAWAKLPTSKGNVWAQMAQTLSTGSRPRRHAGET
jgi:hypothetical protein